MKFKGALERWRYQRPAKWRGHRGIPEHSKAGQFSLSKGNNCPLSFQEWAKGKWQGQAAKTDLGHIGKDIIWHTHPTWKVHAVDNSSHQCFHSPGVMWHDVAKGRKRG